MSVDDWTLMHNDGVHTCNPQCKRPMRVLRREKEELEAEVYRLDCASLALQMELDSVASQKEELAGKVERYESALKDIAAHPYDCGNLCMGVAQQALDKED